MTKVTEQACLHPMRRITIFCAILFFQGINQHKLNFLRTPGKFIVFVDQREFLLCSERFKSVIDKPQNIKDCIFGFCKYRLHPPPSLPKCFFFVITVQQTPCELFHTFKNKVLRIFIERIGENLDKIRVCAT